MGLSRLDNFLKSVRGNIIYVDPNSLDSTDSLENQGNSLSRPFKTIQRALVEASRFSYQSGIDNDRFNRTTILIYPGDHLIDNRPGWIPFNDAGTTRYKLRSGTTSDDFEQWSLSSNFDLTQTNNELYKLNSIHGGVIIPRGISLVGMDLRKTKIRPTYIPNPSDSEIERSAVFRVTGGCYFWQFTILDADPNGTCFKDYSTDRYTPNFSHHKLTGFEYADGVNGVSIPGIISTDRTDLDMYYEKVALVYGVDSGDRNIPDPNYSLDPSVDIQPVIDEYRIVGPAGREVGISSIAASGITVTVTTSTEFTEISVDSPIQISGVDGTGISGFDGQFLVYKINSPTVFQYRVGATPTSVTPTIEPVNAIVSLVVDTVTSASPYIFNVSLRSVYGMCGLLADGDKASGFKSMVVAQFTGIGLQKDDNAFTKYNESSGAYEYSNTVPNLHSDSLAVFKPEYENFHVKATNNAFLQLVSIFAIGYAQHFVVESGGDQSVTNSNSNFGAKAFVSKGFRNEAFIRDDVGYITHIIPPQEIESEEITVSFNAVDVGLTTSVGVSSHLYLYNETNADIPPANVIDGYRVGCKDSDILTVKISQSGTASEYSAKIVMPNTQISKEKSFDVAKTGLLNNIQTGSGVITLTSPHNFETGEKVRVISSNGHLPDGIEPNQIYYAITSGLGITQLKLAQTLTNAFLGSSITPNNKGGSLKIVSKVSDKNSGDIGHPIQWNSSVSNWYVNVSTPNTIYNLINSSGLSVLGEATPRTYLRRTPDNRNIEDTIYRVRYVVPKDAANARPPLDGFIIQESNNTVGSGSTVEIQKYFSTSSSTLNNSTELRNFRFISNANWSTNIANIITELPHDLRIGSEVEILNIKSSNNINGTDNLGFNGTFTVTKIENSKQFSYSLSSDPGLFANDTTIRNSDLPTFKRKKINTNLQIYSSKEIQKYVSGKQDGVYHLTLINNSNSPTVDPFQELSFSQPVQNLYPQTNRDNPSSDPDQATSFATPYPIGRVVIDDSEKSITKETLIKTIDDLNVGFGITNIISNSTGTAHTIFTGIDHGLSGIRTVSIVSSGSSYIQGTYYAANFVGFAGSTTGKNANARIVVGASGTVTNVQIMDGGSVYGIGNTLSIIPAAGIGTTTGFVPAVIQVTGVYDNIGDVISISGVGGTFTEYSNLYRITGISTDREIQVASASTISSRTTSGINSLVVENAVASITGKILQVSSFAYDANVGLATIGFTTSHGLQVNNKVRISGVNSDYFNKDVVIKKVNNLNSIVVNIGKSGSGLSTSGTIFVYITGYTSNGGVITKENENIGGRLISRYAGITTTLSAEISASSNVEELIIPNATTLGLNLGDYLHINREIFRVKKTVSSNTIEVFRAIFGTPRETHLANSVVRRIKVYPVELRRNSIIRASGHTFEYIGFGPGNYSTALPDKQDRQLTTQEEQISQVNRVDGGIINFTAMNSDGDFYTGNKKINSTTGQEETYDSPIPNITGEEKNQFGADVITTSEVYVNRSIKVEGGPEKNIITEFEGPVVFSEKITSTSSKGIEVKSIFIQGDEDVSRNISISTSIPSTAGNYGDVVIQAEPKLNENVGWIYSTENGWKKWGWIRDENAPLYAVGVSSNKGPIGISSLIDFVGTGVSVSVTHDASSGISTVFVKGDPVNYIGITSEGSFIGLATAINFVGEDDGFGMTVNVAFNPAVGIATVTLGTPINVVNFGSIILGKGAPSFASTSIGTRIIYDNALALTQTNYAVGINNSPDELWHSVPQSSGYSFAWYGGITKIATLSGSGALTILGNSTVTAGRFISTVTTGTEPLSIASSTQVTNLNSNYLNGFISTSTASPNTIVLRDSSNNINGNVSHLTISGVGQTGEWYADIPSRLGYIPFNKAGDVCSGVATFSADANFDGLTTIKKVSDIFVTTGTVGIGTTLTCDFNQGPIARSTSSNIGIINIINVPETSGRAVNYTIGITTTSVISNLSNVQFRINGVGIATGGNTLKWLNSIPPTGTAAGYYLIGLTIFRVSSNWEVLGVFASYS